MKLAAVLMLALLYTPLSRSQSAPPEFTDPFALLQAVARTYADAGYTFRMRSITETVENSDLRRDWTKVSLSAVKGPGKLYRIETQSPFGSYIQLSDGSSEWVYLVEAKAYVKRPSPERGPQFPKVFMGGDMELANAWKMRSVLELIAGSYRQALKLGQQTIKIEGRKYPCYVVHLTSADLTRKQQDFYSDDTFWIEKNTLVFRKHIAHTDGGLFVTPTIHIPLHQDITTVYPVMELHAQPSPNEFLFSPPHGAKEVSSLEPDLSTGRAKPEAQMIGKTLPNGALPAASLKAYRGKPLLIDLWATWCGPCLQAMPSLDRVYKDFASKGLQFVTVDEDAGAAAADSYLARHHYAWTNFHDADGSSQKSLGDRGIPLTVLADAGGKILYYDYGGDEAELRKALAGLGLRSSGRVSNNDPTGPPPK